MHVHQLTEPSDCRKSDCVIVQDTPPNTKAITQLRHGKVNLNGFMPQHGCKTSQCSNPLKGLRQVVGIKVSNSMHWNVAPCGTSPIGDLARSIGTPGSFVASSLEHQSMTTSFHYLAGQSGWQAMQCQCDALTSALFIDQWDLHVFCFVSALKGDWWCCRRS